MRTPAFLLTAAMASCTSGRVAMVPAAVVPAVAANAPTLLYRTKGDYRNLVPVLFSDDHRTIVAYPAPSDVASPAPNPTALVQGYWLDNRGIGLNVAFLKLTYAEYANLPAAPSLQDLEALIVDRDPLVTLCDCGPRTSFPNPMAQLNDLIATGRLASRCKVLK